VDLSGAWEGYYKQHGERRPIAATISQTGAQISGSMEDLDTEFDQSLFDAALEAGLPPGSDEQIDKQLRQLYPQAGRRPIRSKSRLPNQSVIRGIVRGHYVDFVKAYQGEHFCGYQMGDEEIGHVIERHCVQYKGRIGEAGKRIEGTWTIVARGSGHAHQGPFVLERV
jgi:hypothetical protein